MPINNLNEKNISSIIPKKFKNVSFLKKSSSSTNLSKDFESLDLAKKSFAKKYGAATDSFSISKPMPNISLDYKVSTYQEELEKLSHKMPDEVAAFKKSDAVKLAEKDFAFKDDCQRYLKQVNNGSMKVGLSLKDDSAIYHYTANGYIRLNKALRRSGEPPENIKDFDKLLRSSINKLPDYKGTVYRNQKEFDEISSLKKDEIFKARAYLSTSSNAQANETFNNRYRLVIKSAKGKDISKLSRTPKEQEVLFPPGSKFKVIEIKNKPQPSQIQTAPFITQVLMEEV